MIQKSDKANIQKLMHDGRSVSELVFIFNHSGMKCVNENAKYSTAKPADESAKASKRKT